MNSKKLRETKKSKEAKKQKGNLIYTKPAENFQIKALS